MFIFCNYFYFNAMKKKSISDSVQDVFAFALISYYKHGRDPIFYNYAKFLLREYSFMIDSSLYDNEYLKICCEVGDDVEFENSLDLKL